MPRTKALASSKLSAKTSVKNSPKAALSKKKPLKKIIPEPVKKKPKKVIVDIIEDEDSDFKNSKSPKIEEAEEKKKEEEIYNSLVTEKYEDEPISEDIDSQKKFFSQLIKETGAKKASKKNPTEEADDIEEAQPAKQVGLYRKLVWKFLAATIVLLGVVLYFSFSKLTLIITPKGEVLNDTLFLKISPAAASLIATTTTNIASSSEADNSLDPRTAINGSIKEIYPILEAVYPSTGEELGTTTLNGQVKIINNSDKSQALVVKTRILSPDNKLFRIKNAVNVPAGGEVTVDIYADKPTAEMAIGPTTFTIPGLWAGLQDKIFARSDSAFTYDNIANKFVKQTDIEAATKDINDRLINNASSSTSDTTSNWLYSVSDKTKINFSAKAGDSTDQFSAKATGDIIAISFSKEEAVKLVTEKLKLLVPDDKELIAFNPNDIVYTLDSYDARSNTATIKAAFTGTMALKADSTIISRDKLVNLSKDQIDNYLKGFPEVKSYELKFFPSFIHKAPGLVDRINIVINKTNN